ncbi:hypothetical protein J3R03_008531 [Actinoplanes couchii]|uniref:Uncharacterized protein n=1 Tax=Actinoplanes couchii TaxID=403638 RepID=A0ABQ3XJJ1_9ACTN|nr:hypothetical protein [Actinoplanes couchii]GID58664.1 hypothetical protein Aco03nite_070680 [Actinoplanes couchii]
MSYPPVIEPIAAHDEGRRRAGLEPEKVSSTSSPERKCHLGFRPRMVRPMESKLFRVCGFKWCQGRMG